MTRYIGSVCPAHLSLGGERHLCSRACVGCVKDAKKRRRKIPSERERGMLRLKEWKSANPNKVLAGAKARNHKVRTATPAWADMNKIREIYRKCPEGHHVDHVIPLNGKLVCGLHVENNLQYLSESENLSKSNKF